MATQRAREREKNMPLAIVLTLSKNLMHPRFYIRHRQSSRFHASWMHHETCC